MKAFDAGESGYLSAVIFNGQHLLFRLLQEFYVLLYLFYSSIFPVVPKVVFSIRRLSACCPSYFMLRVGSMYAELIEFLFCEACWNVDF